MVRPIAVVLLAAVACLPVGCQAYSVAPADSADFQLVAASAQEGIAVIEAAKPNGAQPAEVQGMINIVHAREARLSTALANKKLDAKGAEEVREGLVELRARYAELVATVFKTTAYHLDDDPRRRLQESPAAVATHIDPILQRLDSFGKDDKKVLESRIRGGVQLLGAALKDIDQQCRQRFEKKLASAKNDPQLTAQIEKQQAEFVLAVDRWLAAIDTQIRSMSQSGEIKPSFLMASQLADAVKLTLDPDEKSKWAPYVDLGVPFAATVVEELVPQSAALGQDARWSLGVIESELSPLIADYRKQHSIAVPG